MQKLSGNEITFRKGKTLVCGRINRARHFLAYCAGGWVHCGAACSCMIRSHFEGCFRCGKYAGGDVCRPYMLESQVFVALLLAGFRTGMAELEFGLENILLLAESAPVCLWEEGLVCLH